MTSAYDQATAEREQQATATSRGAAKLRPAVGQELDNPPEIPADTGERPSSRTSLATGDSAGEELLVACSPAEMSVLPGESFDEGSTSGYDEETPRMTEDGREKDDDGNDDGADDPDCSASSLNATGDDASRMSRSASKESSSSSFGDDERRGARWDSAPSLPVSGGGDIAPTENAATCISGKVEDPAEDHGNHRSVLETRAQEPTCDDPRVRQDSRDSHATAARAHREDAEEQDEADREIVQGCQSDSCDFYDAVRSGDVKRVSALIASGCVQNLDEPDWNVSGDPPLLVAATSQCLPVLR